MDLIMVVSPPAEAHAPASNPSSLGDELGWALRAVSVAFQSWADDAVVDLPSGERGYLVLVAADSSAPRSQLAIAQQLGIDKTTMTYLIDALVERTLVERQLNPDDRRARQIVLTDTGRAALDRARQKLLVTEERLLDSLTRSQATEFRTLLATIAASAQRTRSGFNCDS